MSAWKNAYRREPSGGCRPHCKIWPLVVALGPRKRDVRRDADRTRKHALRDAIPR
jgi:hypothetical protein